MKIMASNNYLSSWEILLLVLCMLIPTSTSFISNHKSLGNTKLYEHTKISQRQRRRRKNITLNVGSSLPDSILEKSHHLPEKPIQTYVNTELVTAEKNENNNDINNSKQIFTPFQNVVRAVPFVTAASYVIKPEPFDTAIESLWHTIYHWDVAQIPLFEAEVATFGFYWAIVFFSGLHIALGPDVTRQNRLDGKMPHDPFSYIRPENWYEWFNPTFAYIGSIYLYLQIHDKPPLPELAPTFGVFAIETLFGVWLYDLCYFPLHWIMHNTNILPQLRKCHTYHHRHPSSHSLNSLEVVQHSYLDGFMQVVVNIVVQHISPFGGPKHTLSRLFHNLIVTYLLAESHSGYDLPWMSHRIYPELLGGAPRHDKHHQVGKVYYQQYFKYLDDFFGFVQKEGNNNNKKKKKEELQIEKKIHQRRTA